MVLPAPKGPGMAAAPPFPMGKRVSMIRCPVMFGTGLDDVICPPQTQCAVYNNLHCARKRYLFPGYGHEEIPEFDDMLLDFFTSKEAVL